MKINKNTVTLKSIEITRLFFLCDNVNDMSNYQFEEYKKGLELLKEMKKQVYEHCRIEIEGEQDG